MWKKLIRKRKLQSVMIFFIVVLCMTLLAGAIEILEAMDEPLKKLTEETEQAELTVYLYEDGKEAASQAEKEFSGFKEVKKAKTIWYHQGDEKILFKGKELDLFYRITSYDADVFSKLRPIEGNSDYENLQEGECVLPACIANENEIKVGDVFHIKYESEEKTFEVKGIYGSPYALSSAFSTDILVKDSFGYGKNEPMLYLYAADGYDADDIAGVYRKAHNGELPGNEMSLRECADTSQITFHIIGAVFLALGIIMVIVCGLIINFMIRHALLQDAEDIAVYKTIGYENGDILKMYLVFYFILVAGATFIGLISSVFLSNIILEGMYENMGEQTGFEMHWQGVFCFILITAFVLLIVYAVLSKSRKVKPVVALNGLDSTNTKKKRYRGNLKIAFSSFGIAVRMMVRDKKGILGILAVSIATVYAVNFAMVSLSLAGTMKESNDYWLGIDKSDVRVSVTSGTFEEMYQELSGDDRIERIEKTGADQLVRLEWKEGMKRSGLYGSVYDNYKEVKLPVIDGRNPQNAGEIALTAKMAEEFHKNIGDYMEVYLDSDTKVRLLVCGTFQTYMDMGVRCRLLSSSYTENKADFTYDTCSVYLKEGTDCEKMMEDIQKKLEGKANVVKRTEDSASILNMIIDPQQKAIPPVTILILVIGAVNIFCIVLLKNAANRKMNGIYKSIGYTNSHLRNANLWYVGMIAIISVIIGVPACILTLPEIMKLSLSTFGLKRYPVVYDSFSLAVWNIGILLVFLVSVMISSRSIQKVTVKELTNE